MDKVLKVIACVNCNYSKIGNCGECDYFSVHVYILQANQKKAKQKKDQQKNTQTKSISVHLEFSISWYNHNCIFVYKRKS